MNRNATLSGVAGTATAGHGEADGLWYKDAVIYQLHVKAYFDANDDGIGDFRGLTSKLDYIRDLGVDTIWLMPFYPSPLRDDGYDVADYHNVHPQYGTRQDFRAFVREAHERGLRVITELVVNHTSDQHAWFQAARRAPRDSSKHDFYVWSDDPKRYAGTRIIFTDTEKSNWTLDDQAGRYYWHRFFGHQPDLNFDNPQVLKAVLRTLRFWLDMGVDGFRLDAIPYLCEREGTSNENLPETHAVIKRIRAALDARYANRVLLAEANQWPEDVSEYFGAGDECHMAYHFPLMPRMYMAIAQEDRYPVMEIMEQTPEIPANCQWAIFLRNHDELTLEMVTHRERDYMYRMYAAEQRARINVGIRRRLAPLMENDLDRIKLMNSLLLSMPGSPIIYYGDEIGMGDNFYLGDRDGVRTPMQWSPDRNAGFSRVDPQRLFLPPIMDPVYGFESVNVEAQLREPSSLLNWMRRMLAVRRESRAFGRGRLTFLKPGNRKVLAYVRELGDEAILCAANLSRAAQPVELTLGRFRGRVPVEMFGRTPFPPIGELPYLLTLPGHGFYWFRLAADVEVPAWHEEAQAREDLPLLVLFDGWSSLFRDKVVPWRIGMAERVRAQFETGVLPPYLAAQRWYGAKGEPVKRARIADHVIWQSGGASWLVTQCEVESGAETGRYLVPLALAWEDKDEARMKALAPAALAKVRQQANVGLLADAFADEAFCRAVLASIAERRDVATSHGRLRFAPTSAFERIAGRDFGALPVARPQTQSSNTVVLFGERLFLKAYRRLRPGIGCELEIGRFLTEVAQFPHVVPVVGAVEFVEANGTPTTVALLQAFVANQGDGWDYTLNYLGRFLEGKGAPAGTPARDAHGGYLSLIATLGARTAELHAAFALRTGDPVFDPEPVTAGDLAAWEARVRADLRATLELAERRADTFPVPVRDDARALAALAAALERRIEAARVAPDGLVKSRHHGDYHLGQVLVASNDFVIIDFEGEPARSAAERRAKHSPLRDVAGMLRSFGYARWTALERAARTPEDSARLGPSLAAWEEAARRAFLAGYAEAARATGRSAAPEASRRLIELFELEKVLYELRYEINTRPAWTRIPIAGIRGLAGEAPS